MSHYGVKEKYQPLCQKLVLLMARLSEKREKEEEKKEVYRREKI